MIELKPPPSFEPIPDFICPESFWGCYGYEGDARYVAIYWVPAGDEAAYHDGRTSLVGADWIAYLRLLEGNERIGVLSRRQSATLGSSEEIASHYLVVDREGGKAWIAPVREAHEFVVKQWESEPPSHLQLLAQSCNSLDEFMAAVNEAMQGVAAQAPSRAEIARLIQKQEEKSREFHNAMRVAEAEARAS